MRPGVHRWPYRVPLRGRLYGMTVGVIQDGSASRTQWEFRGRSPKSETIGVDLSREGERHPAARKAGYRSTLSGTHGTFLSIGQSALAYGRMSLRIRRGGPCDGDACVGSVGCRLRLGTTAPGARESAHGAWAPLESGVHGWVRALSRPPRSRWRPTQRQPSFAKGL